MDDAILDSGPSREAASRSKKKRLNRRAKAAKVEMNWKKEKSMRLSAEQSRLDWRRKALEYQRKLNASQAKSLAAMASNTGGQQRRTNPLITSLSRSASTFLPKATPSLPSQGGTYSVVVLDDGNLLQNPLSKDVMIGSGRFGSCTHMVFKGIYDVCVKSFESVTPINSIKGEAGILTLLNVGSFTPHCFGVSLELRAIVMAYLSVDGKPLTLHTAIAEGEAFDSVEWMFFLFHLSRGLQFLHKNLILHNDLKQDNVVLGATSYSPVRPYIVDFGKACHVSAARMYHLSEEEKVEHRVNHSQIAPDLRDGLVKQSASTDIFSFGRIIRKVNKSTLKRDQLSTLVKGCLQYHSHNRPTIESVISELHYMYNNTTISSKCTN